MTTTITPEEFEKALARACMKAANRSMILEPFRCGDRTAVLTGANLREIADEAGLSVPQARRRIEKLLKAAKVMRHDTTGGCTRWWLVGLAPSPVAAPPAPISLPPFVPTVHATPSPATAPRQGMTNPAHVPPRQHWSDVLSVARDAPPAKRAKPSSPPLPRWTTSTSTRSSSASESAMPTTPVSLKTVFRSDHGSRRYHRTTRGRAAQGVPDS